MRALPENIDIKYSKKYQQDILVLAQHEDDQLETLLLQLARGAGAKGLSCMPEFHEKSKIWRPLLSVSKNLIYGYQQEHKLKFIEDSSNKDNKYDRNYLRNKVIPLIKKDFHSLLPHQEDQLSILLTLIIIKI